LCLLFRPDNQGERGRLQSSDRMFKALFLPTVWGNGVVQVVEFPRHNTRFIRRQPGLEHWNKLCKVLLQHVRSPKKSNMPSQHKKTASQKKGTGETKVDKHKKPVEILKTGKASNTTNPLRADLSEKPAKENKAVRETEEDKDEHQKT